LVSAPQPILTWSKPITSGPVPGPRAGHTSSAVGNRLFVFGGGNGIRYLNDLHLLDAGTMTARTTCVLRVVSCHLALPNVSSNKQKR
jgi:hypothetical protein